MPPDEDIRLSRIANGDTKAENNEQEHLDKIVEEPHPDLVDEELMDYLTWVDIITLIIFTLIVTS